MKNLRINRRELPTLRILLYDSGALRTEVRTTSAYLSREKLDASDSNLIARA
jgi:hypothetical protein